MDKILLFELIAALLLLFLIAFLASFSLYLRRKVLRRFKNRRSVLKIKDDDDVKTLPPKRPRAEEDAQTEIEDILAKIRRNEQTGAFERAHRLGAVLASEVSDKNSRLLSFDEISEYNIRHESAVFLSFCVLHMLDNIQKDMLLAKTAQSAFYDTLKRMSEEFYDTLVNEPAFSFFYLESRRRDDIRNNIAGAFCKVCKRQGDEEFAKFAAFLLAEYFAYAERMINAFIKE